MSTTPSTRQKSRKRVPKKPFVERRAASDDSGALDSLRKVKGALGRPLRLERRGAQLHLVLVERRRAPPANAPLSIAQMRAELRERLLVHEHDQAAQVMRHLVFVHDELGRKGWAGVEALPARTIGQALVQAEMLSSQSTSEALTLMIERLRVLKVAADLRDERKSPSGQDDEQNSLLVSETTHEDFEEMQRHWANSLPAEQH